MAERRNKLINSTPAWADITGKPDTATRWPSWNELTGITGTPSASTYLRGDGSWATLPAGVTDHGVLTGLGDDDHTQYYNQTRGDARYSQLSHTHTESDITDLGDYLPLTGGTITGPLNIQNSGANTHLLYGPNKDIYLTTLTAGTMHFRNYTGSGYNTTAQFNNSGFSLLTDGEITGVLTLTGTPTAPETTAGTIRHVIGTDHSIGMNAMSMRIINQNWTLQPTDVGLCLYKNEATARSWYTPPSTTTTMPAGAVINIINHGSGAITLYAGSGTVLTWYDGTSTPKTGTRTLPQGTVATVWKVSNTDYRIWGNGRIS